MLSETSQAVKDKYCIVSLIRGNLKIKQNKQAKGKWTHNIDPRDHYQKERGEVNGEKEKRNLVNNIAISLHSDTILLDLVG